MAASSKGAVLSAVVGNTVLTGVKFAAFLLSGSGAMLSEAIHSFADCANQAMIYFGIRRSERPANVLYPYGYGLERYLFTLLSAVGIFVFGCGVTVYHGIRSILEPHEVHYTWITWAVLAFSFVVEGAVLIAAFRAVWAAKGDKGLFEYMKTTTDPTAVAVLLEDSVACAGVLAAALGILLTVLTGMPVFDAIGAIVIGLMMGGIALWMGYKSRRLILGRAIPKEMQAEILEFLRTQPSVERVTEIKSRVVAADRFKFKAEVEFNGQHFGAALVPWVKEHASRIESEPEAFASEFGEQVLEDLGKEIDRVEAKLFEKFPQLRFVDLEAD